MRGGVCMLCVCGREEGDGGDITFFGPLILSNDLAFELCGEMGFRQQLK